MFEKQQKTAS